MSDPTLEQPQKLNWRFPATFWDANGAELWRAAHQASRSEGTLPLSPMSVPIGAFSAGRFHGDADVFPSMADDVARRIVASLPDTRGLFDRGQANAGRRR